MEHGACSRVTNRLLNPSRRMSPIDVGTTTVGGVASLPVAMAQRISKKSTTVQFPLSAGPIVMPAEGSTVGSRLRVIDHRMTAFH